MLDKFVGDKGGRYGRICRSIYIEPFSLAETESFLRDVKQIDLNRRQIVELYMILGDIPYYLDMLDRDLPIYKDIDSIFFKNGAPLRSEYVFFPRSLFKESKSYQKVIGALSSKMKGVTREEILAESKVPAGGTVSEILGNLCTCDFIRKYASIGKKEKECMYHAYGPVLLILPALRAEKLKSG